ncbi:hypothetical protein M569_03684, partial [Genlisea aurea]
MGFVSKFEVEIVSSIPPKRLFKAFILDGDRLLPKLLSQFIKSIETVEGDGRAGSVKLITTAHGDDAIKTSKQRVDEVDEEKLVFRYTVIEGDEIANGVEKITNTVRFEAGPDGGSITKNTVEYYYAEEGGHKASFEEKAKQVKQKVEGVFK